MAEVSWQQEGFLHQKRSDRTWVMIKCLATSWISAEFLALGFLQYFTYDQGMLNKLTHSISPTMEVGEISWNTPGSVSCQTDMTYFFNLQMTCIISLSIHSTLMSQFSTPISTHSNHTQGWCIFPYLWSSPVILPRLSAKDFSKSCLHLEAPARFHLFGWFFRWFFCGWKRFIPRGLKRIYALKWVKPKCVFFKEILRVLKHHLDNHFWTKQIVVEGRVISIDLGMISNMCWSCWFSFQQNCQP